MSNSLYVYFVKAPLSMSLAFPSLESDTAITVITTTLTEEWLQRISSKAFSVCSSLSSATQNYLSGSGNQQIELFIYFLHTKNKSEKKKKVHKEAYLTSTKWFNV